MPKTIFENRWGLMSLLMLALLLLLILSGCMARAQANKQTLYTDSCGVRWRLIQAGETVPVGLGMCSYSITVPDYPMQGEARFRSNFVGNAVASIEGSYDYSITDGLAYVSEAKYLGRVNSDANDSSNSGAYETAENVVIDKRIREAAVNMARGLNIATFDQGQFEDAVLAAVNESLKTKGVRLNSLALVLTADEQTRTAIDMVTANAVYESNGLTDLGRAVAVARAGAPRITINQAPAPQAVATEE